MTTNQWGESSGGGTGTDRPGAIDQPGEATKKLTKIGGGSSTTEVLQRYGQEDIVKQQVEQGLLTNEEVQRARKLLESQTAQWAGKTEAEKQATREKLYYQTVYREPATRPATVYIPDQKQELTKAIAGEAIRSKANLSGLNFNSLFPQRKQQDTNYQFTEADIKYVKGIGWMVNRDKIPARTPFTKISSEIERFDKQFGERITASTPQSVKNFMAIIDKRVQRSFEGKRPNNPAALRNVAEMVYNIEKGAIEGFGKQPITAAVNLASMFSLVKGTGYAVSKVPWLAKGIGTGKVSSKISAVNVAGGAMASIYGADVAARIAASKNKAYKTGEILGTELIPMAAGIKLASLNISPVKNMHDIEIRAKSIINRNRNFKRFLRDERAILDVNKRARDIVPDYMGKTDRQIAESKGKTLKRAMGDYNIATFKEQKGSGVAIRSGKQYLMLALEEPKQIAITKQVQAVKTKHLLLTAFAFKTKQAQVQQQTQKQNQVSMSAFKAILKQSQPIKLITPYIQQQKNIFAQIQRQAQAQKQAQTQAQVQQQKQKQIQKQKSITKSISITKQIMQQKPVIILKPKTFDAQLDKYIRDRKKKKWVWDIKNPVPTLSALTGEEPTRKKRRRR